MEEEPRFSERKFAAAFDASPDPIAITDIQTGTILDVNHAFEEWSGYSREEMNGKSTQDLNLWLFPEERDAFIRALNSQGSVSKKEVTFRTKSGNLRNMLLFANVFGIGENNYMLSVAEDITGKKQAEEKLRINLEELIQQEIALRETKRELADIIEFLPDATFVINRDGIVIAWNHAMEEMTGITKEEMIGKGDHAYTLPFYGHRRMQLLDLIDLDDHELKSKYKYVTKKGNTLYAEVFSPALYGGKGAYVWATGSPLFDLNGNRIGAIESIRDITERNRVEEALRQANKKLTLLSNITRHDINNKLTVINGILDLLESEQSDPVLCEYLFKVSTASKRISDMIRFTKEYEQIGVNAPSWQKCRTLVDSALKEAMPGQIIVKNDLPNGAEIYSDLLIGKVFYNLIDNALRYGGKITFIRFFVQRSDNLCIIVCEDDGEGVPIEDKMEIFERGFGKNSGLGLTLAREILEMTGITLRETGEPGRGARFEMAVPAANWRENPDF